MKKASCAVSRRRARRARNQRTADWLCRMFECARRSVRQRWRWVVGVCGRPKARVCVRLCCNGRFRETSRSSAHSPSTAWPVAPVPVSSGQPKTKHAPSTLPSSSRKPYHQTISSHRFTSSSLIYHPSSPSPPYHSPHLIRFSLF